MYPFWCCGITMEILRKPFYAWWHIFNAFWSTCEVALRSTHGQNNTGQCDTGGLVPVAILNGVVGFTSYFIISLIGRNVKIWLVVYINAKWIYTSETISCNIWERENLRNIIHVTLKFPFISWCPGSDNAKWTLWVWHSSLNSVEVNFFPASAEIISKYHHPN